MKRALTLPFALAVSIAATSFTPQTIAQTSTASPPATALAPHTRPRTVGQQQPQTNAPQAPTASTDGRQQPQTPATQTGAPTVTATLPAPSAAPATTQTTQTGVPSIMAAPLQPARPIAPARVRARIGEAERLLKTRLSPTAATAPSLYLVTIAALDPDTSQIHLLTLPKQTFLTRDTEVVLASSLGTTLRLRVVRPNYVNTAVQISDLSGRQLAPLVVEYPIEKFGSFREMAYYTSAHPALLTPELVKAGQNYVRTMLDLAAKRLQEKGKHISPQIVDIAERLCIVEHVDHDRFRRDNRLALYEEVYALFALNELDTYRYSVSSAGAGGMVQMIPSTYQMLRRLHPSVGLNPDFVAGMRNHGNALEAMLLHMQDNWNDLVYNSDVTYAMSNGWATQPELVAAGYNSNSARLPGYIRRGGTQWRYLIPRETQMYLQIYKSVESLMPFKSRAPQTPAPVTPAVGS